MRSRARSLPRNSVVALLSLTLACATGRLPGSVLSSIVAEDVPGILRSVPASVAERSTLGSVITKRLAALRTEGWFVEEVTGHANNTMYDERYQHRKFLMPIPERRSSKSEVGWEFLSFSAFTRWRGWSSIFGEYFYGSRDALERYALGRFYRAYTPGADRVYDVIVFVPSGTIMGRIAAGAAFTNGVEKVWSFLQAKEGGVDMDIYGPVRHVDFVCGARSSWGAYTLLQAFEQRSFSAFNFFHGEYGKSRGRDSYVFVALSEAEFVVIQTVLYDDTSREALTGDLGRILGAARDEARRDGTQGAR